MCQIACGQGEIELARQRPEQVFGERTAGAPGPVSCAAASERAPSALVEIEIRREAAVGAPSHDDQRNLARREGFAASRRSARQASAAKNTPAS